MTILEKVQDYRGATVKKIQRKASYVYSEKATKI